MTRAGEEATPRTFSRAFAVTLWSAAAMLAVVFAGLFALPRRGRTPPPEPPVAA